MVETRESVKPAQWRLKITLWLDVTLLVSVCALQTVTLTGMNAAPDMDWRWDTLHNRFSQDVVLLSGFHMAINLDWVLAAVQKVLFPWVEKVEERFRRFREGTL